MSKVALPITGLALGVVGLAITAIFTFGTYLQTNMVANDRRILALLAAVCIGVAGHVFQSLFAHFSVPLFLVLYNFITNVIYAQYSTDHEVRVKNDTGAAAVTDIGSQTGDIFSVRAKIARDASALMFWTFLFYFVVGVVFAYMPTKYLPTAAQAQEQIYQQ